MSSTVSIPANFDLSLFHKGADTTPGKDIRGADPQTRMAMTVYEQTVESLLDSELGVQDDQSVADRESVVDSVAFEEGTDCSEGSIVGLLG